MTDKVQQVNVPEVDPTVVEDPRIAIADEHHSFLEKVTVKGSFADHYDARDVTEVVYRVMRDLMMGTSIKLNRLLAEVGNREK